MISRLLVLACVLACIGGVFPDGTRAATPANLVELQEAITKAVAANKFTVVSVKARKKAPVQGGGEIWYESIGSGVVVDERGYILTNSHVVRGGDNILAGFWEHGVQDVPAVLLDDDPTLDLALLQVTPPTELRKAVFGDSNRVSQGDWVVSLGCPLGYQYSASFGVVSSLQRDLMIDGVAYRNMLQTDADINQGNSGGPLLNLDGEVIGVNVAIYSPDNAYTGIGFVIPSNKARHFVSRNLGLVSAVPSPHPAPVPMPAAAVQPVAQAPAVQEPPALQAVPSTAPAQPPHWTPLPQPSVVAQEPAVQTAATAAPAAPPAEAAAPALPQAKKEPLDINKKIPVDAIHKGYPPCTDCHVITKKSTVNINKPIPHPKLGSCSTCHDLIQEKVASGPVTVAWEKVLTKVPAASWMRATDALACLCLFVVALVAVALRVDVGMLAVPLLVLLGYDIHIAVVSGLAITAASGLVGFLRSSARGMSDMKLLGAVVPMAALGAFASGFLWRFAPPDLVLMALVATLVVAALLQLGDQTLAQALAGSTDSGGLAWRKTCDGQTYAVGLAGCMALTLPVALVGGLFGSGGVWLFLPLFLTFFKTPLPMAEAAASVLALTVGLFGFLGHYAASGADMPLMGAVGCSALVGCALGLLPGRFRFSRQARVWGFILLVCAAFGLSMRILGFI